MGTDTIFGPTGANGLIRPRGWGGRLRFDLGHKTDIEVANVSGRKGRPD